MTILLATVAVGGVGFAGGWLTCGWWIRESAKLAESLEALDHE